MPQEAQPGDAWPKRLCTMIPLWRILSATSNGCSDHLDCTFITVVYTPLYGFHGPAVLLGSAGPPFLRLFSKAGGLTLNTQLIDQDDRPKTPLQRRAMFVGLLRRGVRDSNRKCVDVWCEDGHDRITTPRLYFPQNVSRGYSFKISLTSCLLSHVSWQNIRL